MRSIRISLFVLVALMASPACDDESGSGGTDALLQDTADDLTSDIGVDALADTQAPDSSGVDGADGVDTPEDTGTGDVGVDSASDVDTSNQDVDATDAGDTALDTASDVADQLDTGADTAGGRLPCQSAADCPTTVPCESDGFCQEVDCHGGRWTGDAATAIEDLPCRDGSVCDILVGDNRDSWVCLPWEVVCSLDDDCPFGMLCDSGKCLQADCTVGNEFSEWGPRPCPGTEVCACMEDGVDLNGGRGQCVPLGSDGQPDFSACR